MLPWVDENSYDLRIAMRSGAGLPWERQLGTDQARTRLPKLVDAMRRRRKPSKNLLDNAYGIGPRRQGGALLIPEVDAVAAVERIEELEAETEDLAIALLLRERAGESSAEGVPIDDVIQELGFTHAELQRGR
jgi:hypothetical protein